MSGNPSPLAEACQARGRAKPSPASSFGATFWFAGWLFTLGFAKVTGWKILLALIVWPYLVGAAWH